MVILSHDSRLGRWERLSSPWECSSLKVIGGRRLEEISILLITIRMYLIGLYIFQEPVDIMRVYFFTGIGPTGLRIIAE
jgi:hypothetical protein